MDDAEAPGWAAIDAAMVALHGQQEPAHWLLDSSLGLIGSRLEGLSAYDAGDHWHFVTLGLSDIWTEASVNQSVSGLGYEFTMRVRRPPRPRWSLGRGRTDAPPHWAVRLMQRLGDVSLGGAQFRPGETLDPGERITGEVASDLVAVGFVDDPSLSTLDTPNGAVWFVQAVGMTAPQLHSIRTGAAPMSSLGGLDGLFITDATR